jgi:hypothetical protein
LSPGGVGGQQLGHVGLGPAGGSLVEELGGAKAHQAGRLDVDVRARDRELHTLILADRAAEHLALAGSPDGPVDEPAAVAHALGRDQDPLGVQAVQQVAEPLALLAD